MVAARLDLQDNIDGGTIEQLSETIDHELREAFESVDQVFLDATPRRPRTRTQAAASTAAG